MALSQVGNKSRLTGTCTEQSSPIHLVDSHSQMPRALLLPWVGSHGKAQLSPAVPTGQISLWKYWRYNWWSYFEWPDKYIDRGEEMSSWNSNSSRDVSWARQCIGYWIVLAWIEEMHPDQWQLYIVTTPHTRHIVLPWVFPNNHLDWDILGTWL